MFDFSRIVTTARWAQFCSLASTDVWLSGGQRNPDVMGQCELLHGSNIRAVLLFAYNLENEAWQMNYQQLLFVVYEWKYWL